MTIDTGLKARGAPERSPIAGAGAPSGVDAGPKRYSVQRKMAVVARLLRGEPLQRAVAPIVCDSLRHESRTVRFPGGYDRPGQHPNKACRTAATGDRRQGRSLEKTIHASARNTPRVRDPRQAIRTRRGRRDRLAHRLDLLRAKGLLP